MNYFDISSSMISASAGTGKTYALTSRFLALLALGNDPLRMVALTFTNKAAGEFRNRIIKTLADAAAGVPDKACPERLELTVRIWDTWSGLHQLADKSLEPETATPDKRVPLVAGAAECVTEAVAQGCFPEEINWPDFPKLSQAYYCMLLRKMVAAMSSLRLSTLDSFFNSVVNTNPAAVGLSDVELMNKEQLEQAHLDALLEILRHAGDSEETTNAYVQIFQDITGKEGGTLRDKLLAAIQTYLHIFDRHPVKNRWGKADAFGFTHGNSAPLTEQMLDELAIKMKDVSKLTWKGTGKGNLRHVENGLIKLHKTLKEEELPKKTVRDWLMYEMHAYENAEEKEIEESLRKSAAAAIRLVWEQVIPKAVKKSEGMYDLLLLYQSAYQNAVAATGRLSFDDIMKKAGQLLADADGCNNVAFKLFCSLSHVMLDEFQDTSGAQWNIIEPLLREMLSEHSRLTLPGEQTEEASCSNSLFIVGDEKQSIYEFRGGTPALFRLLKDESINGTWNMLRQSTLTRSYRSAPAIMAKNGFINFIFEGLKEHVDSLSKENPEDAILKRETAFLSQFSTHSVSDACAAKKGYVRIKALPHGTTNETSDSLCAEIIRLLRDELTDEGKRPKNGMSIAILTRKNKEARTIVQSINDSLPDLPIQLVAESYIASASPLGEMLYSFFYWLQHPSDQYRANLLWISPLKGIFCLPEHIDAEKEQLPDVALRARSYWLDRIEYEGYAATLKALAALLPEKKQLRVVDEWLEVAYEFDANGGSLADWLRRIKSYVTKANPSRHYVQVMSMHKSKGTEYDAVILPYTSDDSVDSTDDYKVMLANPDDELEAVIGKTIAEDKKAVLLPPNSSTQQSWLDYKELYMEDAQADHLFFDKPRDIWKERQRESAYNLMYVAMTRAKHANYIFLAGTKEKDKKNEPTSFSETHMLMRAIGKPLGWQGKWEFCEENAGWYDSLPAPAVEAPPAPIQALGAAVPHRMRARSSDSDQPLTTGTIYAPAKARAVGHAAAELGTAVHSLFETIEWLPNGTLPAWAATPQSQAEHVAARALQEKQIAELFHPLPGAEVFNEQSFEAADGNLWSSAIIDRLVIQGDKAFIYDYKTNAQRADFDTYLRQTYRSQMDSYRHLVSGALGIPLSHISTTLVALGCDTPHLVEVHPAEV